MFNSVIKVLLPSFFSTFLSEHNICSSLTNKPREEHGRIGVKLSHSRRQSLFFWFPLFIHTPPPTYNSFEIFTTTSSWSMSDSAFNTNARNYILPFCFSRSSLVNPVFKKNIFFLVLIIKSKRAAYGVMWKRYSMRLQQQNKNFTSQHIHKCYQFFLHKYWYDVPILCNKRSLSMRYQNIFGKSCFRTRWCYKEFVWLISQMKTCYILWRR